MLRDDEDTRELKIGTSGFQAPEVILKKPYSFHCDVWSAGAVLYAMLVHRLPFKTEELTCDENDLDFDLVEGSDCLSREVKDLISGMLLKGPA